MEINGVKQINEVQLQQLLQKEKDDTILIDVREIDEYVHGHIPGVPLIPMNHIPQLVSYFDRKRRYVFICHSGGRSQAVCEYVRALGILDVINYENGMAAWNGPTEVGLQQYIETKEQLDVLFHAKDEEG